MSEEQLQKDEERLIEEIKEMILDHQGLHDHIRRKIQTYWGKSYNIDLNNMSDFQEEFVCQCQVQLMTQFLAKVMVS